MGQKVWRHRADTRRPALRTAAQTLADGAQRNDARAPFRVQELRDVEGAGQIHER
jgi:hypothetical protein